MPQTYNCPRLDGDAARAEQPSLFTQDAFSTSSKKMEDEQRLINRARNALDQAQKILASEKVARIKKRAFNPCAAHGKVREAFEAIATLKKLIGV